MELEPAAALARELLGRYGLNDWRFGFDHARSRFGLCSHHNRTISLSRHLTRLNDDSHVRETILHEIAHAKAGYRAAHGPKWRAIARQLGCRPRACYDHRTIKVPDRAWVGICPHCSDTIARHRRLDKVLACAKCCRRYAKNRFDARFVFVWRRNAEPAKPAPAAARAPAPETRRSMGQLLFSFLRN